ncbi:D-alanyl-D-alanine carboxypeptidase family protein [Lentibacillus sp. CBA3610]|uniref:D-alanyl-D-alanine carboxypeptidase family protein n=1 Tax=Lentibacillus sp. CBA3610 TaxID=2518176 RepID=UPI001594EC5F|nr:D-alanyl-D-alanine carboxypeptidase family protein [Lentibacillus sp. CBA3610]QKY71441.1 D-alanyl-D-alanine carboxypeptidase [Lentibacillus sp. CBA3610]
MQKILLLLTTILALNPLFTTVAQAESDDTAPSIVSEAAIMIDAETGNVLYEKNADASMYPASLTKIATAIYVIETADLDETATVSENARNTEGSRVYLEEDEEVTLEKLVKGLLINSGNDAGVAIAEHVGGSVEQFASDLNEYLQHKIGVQNTHFENPHGLFDSDHVTTAEDLAQITQYAMQNETFREIFGTVEMDWNGKSWDTTLLTHHKLMREMPYDGVTGGKTGFVNQSGYTLATSAQRDDLNLVVITLKANMQEEAYEDTTNLLDYGFDNFEQSTLDEGTTFEAGNQEYKLPQTVTYTHDSDGDVRQEVSDEGLLKLIDQNGKVISSFQLENNDENLPAASAEKDVKEDSILDSSSLMIVLPFIVIIVGIMALVYRRKRKQKREKLFI